MPRLENYRLVLVAPLYAGNVGAVARVAANFELEDLWIVAPQCDWRNAEARTYAKGPAADYLTRFKQVPDLAVALADCTAAVGFTRRGGGLRESQTTLGELAGRKSEKGPPGGRTALVFGREDSGLTTDELLLCTSVCSFEVGQAMPSLNLSHAVAVVVARLYEEANGAAASESGTAVEGATVDELEALFTHWRQTMLDAGMTNSPNPDHPLSLIKRVVQKARPSKSDVAVLRAFLSKTQAAMGTRTRNR